MSEAPKNTDELMPESTATPAPVPADTEQPEAVPTVGSESLEQEIHRAMAAMTPEEMAELSYGGVEAAPSFAPGVQQGRIEAVRGDDVFINLGGKRQGVLSRSQFAATESLAVGEPVEVIVDRHDRESDLLILTRIGQARSAEWSLLKPGDMVEGRIVGLNRGGLEVQLKGVKAFMPASHVDVMHVKDISIFLNEFVRCEVLEIDRRHKSLTVSRRKVLEKERAARREEVLHQLEVGQIRKGVVGNLTEFGAFVDLGGVDGLIHISDLAYRQVKHPSEAVKTGDVVQVKILKIQDGEKGKPRISLGLKQALPDPWETVDERFSVDSTHRVRVLRLADFGAFVELADGIEGLIPVSEMSWGRVNKPGQVVEVGQLVDAKIIRLEKAKRRIALSMKQAQPDPWAEVLSSYAPETQVRGKVTRLTDFGAFVELTPGVEGMIHISELSDRRIRTCSEVVKVGQEVTARVLKVDPQARRIGLSLKTPAAPAPDAPAEPTQPEKAKPRKAKKLRGGLAAGWDWAGPGLDQLGSSFGERPS
jgi:small subunit ribosomal protein S1